MNTALFLLSCPSDLLLRWWVHGKKKKQKKNCQGTLRGGKRKEKKSHQNEWKWTKSEEKCERVQREQIYILIKKSTICMVLEQVTVQGGRKKSEKITDANVRNIENRKCGIGVGGWGGGARGHCWTELGCKCFGGGGLTTGGSVETIFLAPLST